MTVPIDYEILRVIWWALLGILLIGFAIFDGFDLGTAILLPFLGRTDMERRLLINSVGPVWEGNQVWFILGGGASFTWQTTVTGLEPAEVRGRGGRGGGLGGQPQFVGDADRLGHVGALGGGSVDV